MGKDGDQDGYITATCQNVTMARLAELLPAWAPNYFSLPVVDKTGIEGRFEIHLNGFQWPSDARASRTG